MDCGAAYLIYQQLQELEIQVPQYLIVSSSISFRSLLIGSIRIRSRMTTLISLESYQQRLLLNGDMISLNLSLFKMIARSSLSEVLNLTKLLQSRLQSKLPMWPKLPTLSTVAVKCRRHQLPLPNQLLPIPQC